MNETRGECVVEQKEPPARNLSEPPQLKGKLQKRKLLEEKLAKEGLAREVGNQRMCYLEATREEYFLIITSKVAHQNCCKAVLAAEDWECPGMKVAWCGLRSAKGKRSQGKGMERSKLFPKVHLWRKSAFFG